MAFQNFKCALVLVFSFALPHIAQAQETVPCRESASLLLNSCKTPVAVHLRIVPYKSEDNGDHVMTVTGTYSSADRFGIEGLVIQGGKLVSRRYKNWDGVLIVDAQNKPHVFHSSDVTLMGEHFNLKEKPSRTAFIAKAKDLGVSVLQSHLLISNGGLDVSDVVGAPEFYRRMLVTFDDGSFGVWQTADAKTLYAAATEVKKQLDPKMALNLDMGAYDFCLRGPKHALSDCGALLVPVEKLTNLLEFVAE